MTSVWIRNTPASAAAVRHFLHDEVEKAGLGPDLADDAALLASELVGNSIRHARALPARCLNVTWLIAEGGVRVQVTDAGGGSAPGPAGQPGRHDGRRLGHRRRSVRCLGRGRRAGQHDGVGAPAPAGPWSS